MDTFNHLSFFSKYDQYPKRKAMRRFETIVEKWITDENKKELLLTDFHIWNGRKDAKQFWKERNTEIVLKQTVESEPSSSTLITSQDSSSTLNKISQYLSSNNRLPYDMNEHYYVDELDFSVCFHNFRNYVQGLVASKSILTFESHVSHILALSSILLVRKNVDPDLEKYFLNSTSRLTQKILKSITKEDNKFPEEALAQMMDIYDSILNKKCEHDIGILKLHQVLINQKNPNVKRCIKLIIRLLEVLPYSYDQNSTKERKLCSRYLHPILQTLFDDLHSENPVAFDFTDELNEECKSNISLTHKRPDGHIYSCTNKMDTLGYVEVKGLSALNNHYLINLDLARLGVFCKNALDIHGGQGKIAIQAVGVNITFYLVQRLNRYMYSMVELDFLQFPKSFEELRPLFAHMDNIMNILQIFHKQCTPTTKEDLYDNVSDTLKSPILRAISNAK